MIFQTAQFLRFYTTFMPSFSRELAARDEQTKSRHANEIEREK